MTVSKFKVGDRVYAPFHDCGIVTKITNDDTYPIEVTWEVSRYKYGDDISTFTPDGFLFLGSKRDWTRITHVGKALEGGSKFHVGDKVSFPHHGLGTVIADHNDGRVYPIEVKWDNNPLCQDISTFTPEGLMVVSMIDDADKLTIVEKEEEKEVDQIANATHKKEEQNEGKSMAEDKKFKVGDRVFSSYYGFGVVYSVNSVTDSAYPVVVKWENPQNNAKELKTTSFYTVDGKFRADGSEAERDIYPLKISSDLDEEAVDPMIDTLDKKTEDAINPSHYKVDGLPEAIDIINHLMHREQLEGFYWGNIIKYAYRYGRKGDKAETAGKIAWYAQKLKALGECESK